MNKSRGMELLRTLDEGERLLITDAWAAVCDQLPRQAEIHWLNLYLNHTFRAEYPQRDALHAWVTETVQAVYAATGEVHVLSYGFIVNPAGSTKEQLFHCDYSYTSSNLFVPLTPVTLANATQYLRRPLHVARMDEVDMIGTLEQIMDLEGLDAIEVCQLACRPFCLVRLLPDTPHRGIRNQAAYDRVMLWVTVDDHDHPLREHTVFQLREKKEDFADWPREG